MSLEFESTAAAGRPAATPAALAFTETEAGSPGTAPLPRSDGGTLLTGRQLAHFRIEHLLGAGGMGEVYLATDLALDRPVALKIVAHGTATVVRRERLIREARAQARIYHPNVCHIYYIGESDGLLFFAMELVTGKTFSDRLGDGPVALDEALDLIRMAALGLREATRCGFTHRDVKPSNLMVDQHGNVKVMDFGLVAGTGSVVEASSGSVEQTSMAGTPLYMAPEQARGEAIDFRADIYALGATLYHLVAGKPPFAGDTVAALIHQHSSSQCPPLVRSDVAARALQPIDGLCARMMAKNPMDRHASYDDLIRELELLSSLHSRPAGATVRLAAAALDLGVLLAVNGVVSSALDRLIGISLWSFISVAALFALYRFGSVAWLGRSLGQSIFELEVISMVDGRRPGRRQSLRRVFFQIGLPALAAIPFLLLIDGKSIVGGFANAALVLLCLSLPLHLYYSAMRQAQGRTIWDRRSATMVRYRRR